MTTPESICRFTDALKKHADNSVCTNISNAKYADQTRQRAEAAKELIESKRGAVAGVAISWRAEIQPLAEIVFGRNLDGTQIGLLREYSPTAFEGILGRTCIISTDEMLGAAISLDLAAQDSV